MKRLISSIAALVAVACLVLPVVKKDRCIYPMTANPLKTKRSRRNRNRTSTNKGTPWTLLITGTANCLPKVLR